MNGSRTGFWALSISLFAAVSPAHADAGIDADLVLHNGRIYTVDAERTFVTALAVTGDRIAAVGSDAEITPMIAATTHAIDLDGAFAMPGFNDAHLHLGNAALRALNVDLSTARSLEEFQAIIAAAMAARPPGSWLYGRGWDESKWPSPEVPGAADLDAVSTQHALFMERADGHSAVVNSLAMERAGISRESPDPPGGMIVRDAEGRPTGWLKERAADIVYEMIPRPRPAEWREALRQVQQEALSFGVTSVQDDTLRSPGLGPPALAALRAMRAAGELRIRVTTWLPFEAPLEELIGWREKLGTTDPWLRSGLLKTNIDGSGGSLSAAMLEPYATAADNRGLLLIEPEVLTRMVLERDAVGFQIGIHAIGDRANRIVLDAYASARNRNPERDTRHRIEHAQFVAAVDVPRFAELAVIPSIQPCHLLTDLRWAPAILGPQREGDAYRWHSFIHSGARPALGTDYPVEPIDPRRGLYTLITREFENGGPAGGWQPQERIDIHAAIRGYTLDAAYAEFTENDKGSLEPGKFADIVVLEEDLTQIRAQRILDTPVLMTIVGGDIAYRAEL